MTVVAIAVAAALFLGDSPLERRAKDVAACIAKEPKWADDLFDPSFLRALPAEKLRSLFTGLFAQYGSVTDVTLVSAEGPSSGKFDAVLEKGVVMPMTVAVGTAPPRSIIGLWFGAPSPALQDISAVTEEFGKLPGSVSFSLARLGDKPNDLEVVASKNGDESLAIGSAFKLYVLGALVREVSDGKRKWSDVITIDPRRKSLPSGVLHTWPDGAPITLHSLASAMISVSDNTAADHLLFALGRETVEAILEPMGNRSAARNRPFLATVEMFKLKGIDSGKGAVAYLATDVAGRRAYLAKEIAALSTADVDGSRFANPLNIDTIEWFASANDLCRAMDWLRHATDSGSAAAGRDVLAINRGLDISKEAFPYVGFKGGSEGGVLDLTYLLRAKDGTWWAFSAAWNDPKAPVDETRFFGLVTRALRLLGTSPPVSKK
ncbi:MAG: serine hydrolase [Planctomycetes bacterium]|nr:serine hydrolase [Planctomycetota bacterium]MBI3845485.1 serine hydrolase [Planctomycetota bacterium]